MSDINNPPPPPGGTPPPPPPPGGWQPSGPAHQQANFGQRLATTIIDGLILGVPFGVIIVVLTSLVPTELAVCQGGTAICEQPTGGGWAILGVAYLAMVLAAFWYIGEFEGRRGATIGRKVMGCKVVKAGTDETLGFGRAIGRYFARIPSSFICYLGYFWMLWDDKSQTWHDKIVGSQVVKA